MATFRQSRVLVVDDERDMRELLQEVLELVGFEVASAGSGTSAVKMLGEGQFDAVISDLLMNEGDGYFVLDKVKTDYGSNPPVIILSGTAGLREADFKEKGAFALMKKPFLVDDLVMTINAALAARKAA